MYRARNLARWLSGGILKSSRRTDHQVCLLYCVCQISPRVDVNDLAKWQSDGNSTFCECIHCLGVVAMRMHVRNVSDCAYLCALL